MKEHSEDGGKEDRKRRQGEIRKEGTTIYYTAYMYMYMYMRLAHSMTV